MQMHCHWLVDLLTGGDKELLHRCREMAPFKETGWRR